MLLKKPPILGFHPTFSRLGIAQSLQTLALHIWLDDKVFAHPDAINFKHPLSKKIERGLLYEEKVVLLHADYYQAASTGGRPRVNSCVCNLAKA